MSDVKRYRCLYYPLTTPDGVPTGYGEVVMMVLASDYDALSTQLREARELLRWAIEFVTTETIDLANCRRDPVTHAIEPEEVADEVVRARDWIERARRAI